MSAGKRVVQFLKEWQSLIVGLPALVVAAFGTWVFVDQVRRAKGPDYITPIIYAAIWITALLLVLYAIIRNLQDAHRAEKEKAARMTEVDEIKTHCENEKRILQDNWRSSLEMLGAEFLSAMHNQSMWTCPDF
jgi:thiol:disulfide interchange protein